MFLDEHPDGIDDGYFLVFVNRRHLWGNLPANNHNGACGFAFADNHAEVRKWLAKEFGAQRTKTIRVRRGPQRVG